MINGNDYKHFVGKQCDLHIVRKGSDLFFNAVIINITPLHVLFIDKFNKSYIFLLSELAEVKVIN